MIRRLISIEKDYIDNNHLSPYWLIIVRYEWSWIERLLGSGSRPTERSYTGNSTVFHCIETGRRPGSVTERWLGCQAWKHERKLKEELNNV